MKAMRTSDEICGEFQCDHRIVVDEGCNVCVLCGSVVSRCVDTQHTSFQQSYRTLVRSRYSRQKRYNITVLGALQRRAYHHCDINLVRWLRSRRTQGALKTPEDLLRVMGEYQSPRKPYVHAARYWEAVTGEKLPTIDNVTEKKLQWWFQEIFYATERLNLPGPRIPMATVLQLTVRRYTPTPEALRLIRFTRVLRCEARRAKYKDYFDKCCCYVENGRGRQEQE